MNKDELRKYVDGLADDAEIIVITKEQTAAIPWHCERIDAPGNVIWLLRKLKDGIWVVFIAWVLQGVDVLPKPQAVCVAARDKIEFVMKHTNYDFPHTEHDNQYPHISFDFNGATHYLPPSGLSAVDLAETGSFGGGKRA
jgi:hypothetical protein